MRLPVEILLCTKGLIFAPGVEAVKNDSFAIQLLHKFRSSHDSWYELPKSVALHSAMFYDENDYWYWGNDNSSHIVQNHTQVVQKSKEPQILNRNLHLKKTTRLDLVDA